MARLRLSAPTAALLIAGCSSSVGLTFDQRWTGPVTPDEPGCGSLASGTLTRRKDAFTFTPNDGVLVLDGAIGADGTVSATRNLIGADHRPFVIAVAGRLTPAGFDGRYTASRCQYHVSLRPPN